jgi:hypothetical protein
MAEGSRERWVAKPLVADRASNVGLLSSEVDRILHQETDPGATQGRRLAVDRDVKRALHLEGLLAEAAESVALPDAASPEFRCARGEHTQPDPVLFHAPIVGTPNRLRPQPEGCIEQGAYLDRTEVPEVGAERVAD